MSNKKIIINGQEIKPGKKTIINLTTARLHTRTLIEVPIIIERSKIDGPIVLITGGIHGDEVNGVEIVRQLIHKKYNKPDIGMVICLPVVNVFGFLNQTRAFPDGRDLNRCFPGGPKGSLASRFAHSLMSEILPLVDYCLDYHTGGGARFNYSQIRVEGKDAKAMELAKIFGAKFIVHAPQREKSFRESASKIGKKVLLFEGGKTIHLDRQVTKVGIQGALNILHHLGIHETKRHFDKADIQDQVEVLDSFWIRAKYAGMYRSAVRSGSWVQASDKIGSISDPFGDFEKSVFAPNDGYILCATHLPIVNQGDALIHISKKHNDIINN